MLLGAQSGPWQPTEVRTLESRILESCNDLQARSFLRLLRKFALRWSSVNRIPVELPRIPAPQYQYKNPFSQDTSARLREYDDAKELLAKWLEDLCQAPKLTGEYEQVLTLNALVLSAILHGGLFSTASLVALLRAIPEMANRTLIVDGRLQIELSLSWSGFANAELRRWQPDPLTAVLWARTPDNAASALLRIEKTGTGERIPSDATVLKRFGAQFRTALATAGIANLKRLQSVLTATFVVAHTQIPPIIARYASREILSHSMSRAALARFTQSSFPRCAPPPATNMANNEPTSNRGRRNRSDDPLWLQAVLAAIESPNAKSELEHLGEESPEQQIRTFSEFAHWLCSVSSRSGSQYKPKAAIEIVGILGRYLAPFTESANPIEQDPETMTELYWQAMEGTGPATSNRTLKGDLSRAIAEFDRYLAVRRSTNIGARPKLPWFPTGLADVDANPASHEDYSRLLERIENEWPPNETEMRNIAWLLVVLGFRCGLRRMEALYLQVQDVLVRGRGELLVRPTPLRRLKSSNAERRLPIGLLLTTDEMTRLQDWKQKRLSNPDVGPTDCLFGIDNQKPVSEKIFNQINKLMRPTGTPNHGGEHFHELRKGFGTWMFLALMLADSDPIPVLFPRLQETTKWLCKAADLKASIFRHPYPSRKYAFLLARWLGHGSPSTTLENYIFVADSLLSAYLSESKLMQPEPKLVVNCCRLADSTWRSRATRGPHALPIKLWRDRFPGLMAAPVAVSAKSKEPSPGTPADWVGRTWEYLYRVATGNEDHNSLAKQYGFDEKTASETSARANYLAGLPFPRGGFRHYMVESEPESANPEPKRRLNCPLRPRGSRHKTADQLAIALLGMSQNHHQESMQSALSLYVEHVDRENFVRISGPSSVEDVRRFVYFMGEFGFPKRDLQFVSGDSKQGSGHAKAWKRELRASVDACPRGGDFGPRTAISIRPSKQLNSGIAISGAVFRFLMTMAFTAFGELPDASDPQTLIDLDPDDAMARGRC